MPYKLLLLDVDGTVLPIGPYTTPSARVAEALKAAHQRVFVAFASGRSYAWLEELIRTIGIQNPSIANGGSQILMPDGRVVWEATLPHDAVRTVLRTVTPGTTVVVNDSGTEVQNPTSDAFTSVLAIKIQELDRVMADTYHKLLEGIPEIAYHENASWKNDLVDLYITHRDATKRHAVEELMRMLNVEKSEIIGAGDGKNDIPLFEASGLKVAMGNAHEELKALADYIAPSVDEDGVADIVEKFILQETRAQ